MGAAERMKKKKSNNPDSVLLQPKIMKLPVYSITFLLLGLPVVRAADPVPALAPELPAAAERGDADAQYQLARAYLRGEGVVKDPQKAFELMKAAADQGNAEAIGGLGYFYSIGLTVPKDEKQALEWFRKGAEKGSAKSQFNLGNALLKGKGGAGTDAEKSQQEALQWIKKAADQGLPEAGLAYGRFLYFGDHGLAKDYESAARYLKIAAAADIADAQNILGFMNNMGWGGPVDKVMAEQWFRKAALQGNLKAQANLGRILNPLSEDRKTRIEALAWLLISAERGEVTARKELDDTVEGLKDGEMDAAKARAPELLKLIHKKAP